MKFDKTTIIAVVLCLLAYVGYESYLNNKYPDRFKNQKTAAEEIPHDKEAEIHRKALRDKVVGETLDALGSTLKNAISYERLDPKDLIIENDTSIYTFDQKNGSLRSLILKDYKNEDKTDSINLLEETSLEIYPSLGEHKLFTPGFFQATREDRSIEFSRNEGPWLLSHKYEIDANGYGANVHFRWKNASENPIDLNSVIVMHENLLPKEKSGGFSFLPGMPTGHPFVVAAHTGDFERFDAANLCSEKESKSVHTGTNLNLTLLAFDAHYFVKALLPQEQRGSYKLMKALGGEGNQCTLTFYTENKQGFVNPNEEVSISYKAWFGPKSTYVFGDYDKNLETTLDLGFFAKISHPLLAALHFLYNLVKNWGLAIVILTLFLKILFYPLTRQAAVSMNKMKKLQPEMNALREKYKNDPQRMQQELMKFMSFHKVNPMKGCLPILPQIPVFFAFYRVLSTSIELRHAPFFGWIYDLSSADPYYITPLLLGVAMFLQQKLTPTTGLDKAQERVMMMLPIFFTIMMLTLPAGMVLYMLTNTVVSIAQQQWLNKRLNV